MVGEAIARVMLHRLAQRGDGLVQIVAGHSHIEVAGGTGADSAGDERLASLHDHSDVS